MAGGRTQQSASGGFNSASSSMSVRSFGRFSTQTLSSLSTASPVTPPIFHLLGRGLGQSGSNLNFGAAGFSAPSSDHQTSPSAANAASPIAPVRRFMHPPFRARHAADSCTVQTTTAAAETFAPRRRRSGQRQLAAEHAKPFQNTNL